MMKGKISGRSAIRYIAVLMTLVVLLGACGEKAVSDQTKTGDLSAEQSQTQTEHLRETASSPSTTGALNLVAESDPAEGRGRNSGYGVVIGLDAEEVKKLEGFEELVVDPRHFSAEVISDLKEKNLWIYAYLNIGAVRKEEEEFWNKAFADVEYQSEWRWISPATEGWSDYVLLKAEQYRNYGVDGFFIDGLDVYAQEYSQQDLGAMLDLLRKIKALGLRVIGNGGQKLISDLTALSSVTQKALFDGVNQEFVFTAYDYMNKVFYFNSHTEELLKYLSACKDAGLQIYLLEYMRPSLGGESCETGCACETADKQKDVEMADKIRAYCEQMGYQYYIAPRVELD